MGRLLLVAVFATIGFGGPIFAKPDQGGHGKNKQARIEIGLEPACPPGLRRKGADCIPPGQGKKLFEVGDKISKSDERLRPYRALPYELRMRYGGALDPHASYIYDENFLYRVDPATMVVRQILRSLL